MWFIHAHQVPVMRPAQFAAHGAADLLIGNFPFADPFFEKPGKTAGNSSGLPPGNTLSGTGNQGRGRSPGSRLLLRYCAF
jgi:hypothetical protein